MVHLMNVHSCFFELGSTYNIPVAIFLRKEYPYYCPTCIVQPTPDMMISPSQYVNAQGMVFLPYLHEWKHVSVM
jgi:ESCRT-I complex subunit TSG101